MRRLRRWWQHWQQTHATLGARMDRIEANHERLQRQLNVHVLATDTRLSIYDVLIPKTLADLSQGLHDLAIAQQRLADIWERRETGKSEVPLAIAVTRDRSA